MLKMVQHVNYKADYTFSPPIVKAVINTDDIQSVVPEDSYGHRVGGPLFRITFTNGKDMLCQGRIEEIIEGGS